MAQGALFLVPQPTDTRWALGRLDQAPERGFLIGWRSPTAPVDAGVPAEIARAIAHALTQVAGVAFLTSSHTAPAGEAWEGTGDGDYLYRLGDAGMVTRIRAAVTHQTPNPVLISTEKPDEALSLFDDPAFPWWQQGQLVLLSEKGAKPPTTDRDAVLAVFDTEWSRAADALIHCGYLAVLRPGVDGDVMGIRLADDAFEARLFEALAKASAEAGLEWRVATESELADRLSD